MGIWVLWTEKALKFHTWQLYHCLRQAVKPANLNFLKFFLNTLRAVKIYHFHYFLITGGIEDCQNVSYNENAASNLTLVLYHTNKLRNPQQLSNS